MITCKRCNTQFDGGFCPLCGYIPEEEPINMGSQAGFDSNSNPNNAQPRFCTHCGHTVTYSFCGFCGTPVAPQQNIPPSGQFNQAPPFGAYSNFTANYQNYRQSPNTPKHKLSPWVIALICAYVFFQVFLPILAFPVYMRTVEEILDGMDSSFYGDSFSSSYQKDYNENEKQKDFPDTHLVSPNEQIPADVKDNGDSILPNGVSIAEYRQLEFDMSYAQISYVIGGDSLEQSISPENSNVMIALWPGEYNVEAIISVEFTDGVATQISQENLY